MAEVGSARDAGCRTDDGLPVVVLTGASSGIGAATALALAGRFRIAAVARRSDPLEELARMRVGIMPIAIDVTGADAAAGIVDRVISHFGRIDALVNNAGAFEVAPIAAVTADHIERLWRLNVQAPMLLTCAALPHLSASRCATIVNVSSVAAEAAFPDCSVYSATKAALEAWSRVLREELRPRKIRVGVIAPGATATAAWPAGTGVDAARMCRPQDVAEAIAYMLSAPRSASVDRLVVTPPAGPL
jgi:NADP-dependent 3-hydroxy acid dehydrogenase YdfG